MKIDVMTIQCSQFVHNLVPLIAEPHNFKFDHAEGNLFFFRVHWFPKKAIVASLMRKEGREVTISGAFLRACFRKDGMTLRLIVRYSIKDKVEKMEGGALNCYTITEKEKVYAIENTREEAVRLVEPYLLELDAVNGKKTAKLYKENFLDWAHPLTLEDVISKLTEKQKREAAKILRDRFAA